MSAGLRNNYEALRPEGLCVCLSVCLSVCLPARTSQHEAQLSPIDLRDALYPLNCCCSTVVQITHTDLPYHLEEHL